MPPRQFPDRQQETRSRHRRLSRHHQEADFDIASVGEGEVRLERAQTIMQGAPSCTFRYTFAPR